MKSFREWVAELDTSAELAHTRALLLDQRVYIQSILKGRVADAVEQYFRLLYDEINHEYQQCDGSDEGSSGNGPEYEQGYLDGLHRWLDQIQVTLDFFRTLRSQQAKKND